ncbi:MAG: hypothetical protein LBU48_01010 [Coriobacteriales bacterium]|nr:hypothetical protein [Coriobacteriales bacterium]
MDPKQDKQFSHISIGTATAQIPVADDEDELFAIGAVELLGDAQSSAPQRVPVAQEDPEVEKAAPVVGKDAGQTDEGLAETNTEDIPNPLARRIVLILAVLGFLLIVLYVLEYWGIITLPF